MRAGAVKQPDAATAPENRLRHLLNRERRR
jgi:hypothetical protein